MLKKEKYKNKYTKSWIMYDEILENGIIKTKDNYIKLIEILPINFYFKSESEQEIILENFKNLFKSLKFDIQIYVYSQKEEIENIFNQENKSQKENEVQEEYKIFLEELLRKKEIYYKRFFIVIKEELNENFFINLKNKEKIIKSILSKTNECNSMDNKNDVLEIIKNIYC